MATAFGFNLGEQVLVALLAEEIAGVEMAFAPGLLCGLAQLPIVEAGTQAAGDGLMLQCSLIVSEAIISEAHGIREEPTLTIVLCQEGLNTSFAITTMLADLCLQIVEGDQRQHRMP